MLFLSQSQRTRLSDLMQDLVDEGADPVRAANQLLEVDPEHAASYCVLGNAAEAAGDHAEAERLLWKALEFQPYSGVIYASLSQLYRENPDTRLAAETLWVLALWAVGLSEEVPPEFCESFQDEPEDPEVDYADPGTFRLIAEQHEQDLEAGPMPAGLRERIRPYWLLKELACGAENGFSTEALNEIRAAASLSVPVWWAALRAWARDQSDTNQRALWVIVALLGEYAGPEILPDLWELSNLRDQSIFLHAHWALCRMADRYPAETVRSILDSIPNTATGLRCGMAEHLGLMREEEGAPAAILALMQDFGHRAGDEDAPYLLLASADALSEIGQAVRAKELFVQYERLLGKESRRWMRETLDQPGGFVPRIVEEGLPDLDIEDVCLGGVLMEEEDDEELDHDQDEDDDWEDDDDVFDEHEIPAVKPGRNDPCWCGSGKKYKKCHLEDDEKRAREEEDAPAHPADPAYTEAMEGLMASAERFGKRRHLMEAAQQYFGDDVTQEEMEQGSEDFLLWYLFDFRPAPGRRTALEEHLRKRGELVDPEVLDVLESWRDSRYGLFETVTTEANRSVTLKDAYAGDTLLVTDLEGSHELEPGEYLLARVEERKDGLAFSSDPLTVSPDALPVLRKFVETEIKTTGQAPAEFVRANVHRLHRVVADV